MNFETHHDIYLPVGQCWHMICTLNFYLKIKNKKNKSKEIWNIEELRKLRKYCEWNRGDLLLLLFLFMEVSLHCDVLFAILEFHCIECFAYALASLVFIYSYVCTRIPALLYPIPFLVNCFPGTAILPSSPHSCKALLSFVLFSFTLLSSTLVPPCSEVVVMTLIYR